MRTTPTQPATRAEPTTPITPAFRPASFLRDRMHRWLRGGKRYFEPLAVLEASVSIVSGVLIWMGIWDLMDVYIVPDTLSGKLLMVLFGMIGLLCTRTLYDKEMLQAIRMSNGLGGRPDSASLLTAARSDVPSTEVAADAAASSISSGSATSTALGFTSIDLQPAGGGGAPPAAAAAEPAAGGKRGAVPGRWAERRYFRPPPLSCGRCTRALFAIFVGLTLWVGVWDLVDYHLLPALTHSCKAEQEPNSGCGAIKVGLVALGALGLYCTRSLYGENMVHAAQFQRFQ